MVHPKRQAPQRRHTEACATNLKTWLAFTSYRRATGLNETPGTRVCAQIIRFSSSDHVRRRRRIVAKTDLDSVHQN